jgi:cytochrome c553
LRGRVRREKKGKNEEPFFRRTSSYDSKHKLYSSSSDKHHKKLASPSTSQLIPFLEGQTQNHTLRATMRKKSIVAGLVGFGLAAFMAVQLGAGLANQSETKTKKGAVVERGKWLVNLGGCDGCHSPKVLTPKGPVPDTTRLLSGHPAAWKVREVPPSVLGPDKWGALASGDFTAWAGPWGMSFAANLTPDVETGMGSWTVDMFIKAMRTGQHMGEGRDILPPMPWEKIGHLSDEDLKAMFAYLESLKPIVNAVPDPVPPGAPEPMK